MARPHVHAVHRIPGKCTGQSGTQCHGLVYTSAARATSDVPLRVWSDATWAPSYGNIYDNYRSTTGWCTTAYDNLLSWNSHRQPVVAQSSTESEWHAGADAAKEAAFIKNLFDELGINTPRTVPLMCDNQSTIKQSLNQVDQRRCRHLGMRSHFLRQQCHSGHLCMQFVPSTQQLGDLYTKCLPTPQHEKLRKNLNVMSVAQFHAKFGKAKSPDNH